MKLIWNILKVLSAITLPVAGALLHLKKIEQEDFVVAVLVLAAFLILREILDHLLPKRERPSDIQLKIPAGNTLLKSMLSEYEQIYARKRPGVPAVDVRANLMLLRHDLSGKNFQIAFEAILDNRFKYSVDEKKMRWKKSQGAVGHVWSSGREQTFCQTDKAWQHLQKNLSTQQKDAVSTVGSIFIVPIGQGSVIGLLCLDSSATAVESLLGDNAVHGLVQLYANVLRPLCAENGISKTGR